MTYEASFDKTTKIITTVISLLFLGITAMQVVIFIQYGTWMSLGSALLLPVIYLIAYLYCPVNYRIDGSDIVVHRPASDVRFLRSDVRCIRQVQKEKLKGTIRLFGVGGLFGYFGQFSNAELGHMTWYATKHRDKTVLIELKNDKKIIVTPDEPERFIEQFEKAA